ELSVAESSRTLRDGIKHRLDVGRRAGDDAQDLARRRLLLERLGQLAVPRLQEFRRGLLLFPRLNQLTAARLELLQRLRQALLKVGVARAVVLQRLLGDRDLGIALTLRGLRPPTHRPLLHRAMIGARLRSLPWHAAPPRGGGRPNSIRTIA